MKNLIANKIKGISNENAEARDLWIKKQLESIPEGAKILDAGAGEQRLRKWCLKLDYFSQDFAEYDGTSGEGLQNPEFDYGELDYVSDITSIPVPDSSFDAVVCIEVIEHVPDPIGAVKELSRLLKPGGTLILTAPFASYTHMAPYHFSTGFTRYWYELHLESIGMEILEISPNGSFFELLSQEMHRAPSMFEKYSGRKMNIFKKAIIAVTMMVFRNLARETKSSSEFACFGWHIRASKLTSS